MVSLVLPHPTCATTDVPATMADLDDPFPAPTPSGNPWGQMKLHLQAQLTAPSFESWIQPLQWGGLDTDPAGDTTLHLRAESAFAQAWVLKHYRQAIHHAAQQLLGHDRPITVQIQVDEPLTTLPTPACDNLPPAAPTSFGPPAPPPLQSEGQQMQLGRTVTSRRMASDLNPRYTFENLVVGQHNRLAHAAALAIAESPGASYNPLFFYGGVGLGKTHLMQAIGHFCHQVHPNLVVRYITAEQFTNDMIDALARKSIKSFRDRYRQVDVLLLDDVQFLEGKERTQIELFHTLNVLYESGKQIILTSDRPPQRLTGLEDRLRSRCEWGLVADVQAPDLETRIAILRNKAERESLFQKVGASLNEGILTKIAQTHTTSIRELEGALNQIAAYSLFNQTKLASADVQRILQPHQAAPESLNLQTILKQVASYYHLQVADLKGPSRRRDICTARHVAIHVMRQLTHASFPQMAVALDKKSHTSILHGFDKMQTELMQNPSLSLQMEELLRRIRLGCRP
jgi:chromosomal replication initiator protein